MIIFISGSINSGKTTVATILAERLPRTAHIEVDNLRDLIKWMSLKEALDLNLDNTSALINNLSKRNINSIVTYPLSKRDFEYIIGKLERAEEYLFFTLDPGISCVLKNRGSRELTEREKERIKYHYQTGVNNPGFGIVIDNSDQTPSETAEVILRAINK